MQMIKDFYSVGIDCCCANENKLMGKMGLPLYQKVTLIAGSDPSAFDYDQGSVIINKASNAT